MTLYKKNLYHIQELQKRAHDMAVKSKSYTPNDKVWLNNKYIKTTQNCKLKVKFFGSFQVLYLVGNYAYKLKLQKKWKIHNVFYVSLLEYDIIRKRRVDKRTIQLEFEVRDNGGEYKIEKIQNSAVYAKILEG